jgi:hypothetical protein
MQLSILMLDVSNSNALFAFIIGDIARSVSNLSRDNISPKIVFNGIDLPNCSHLRFARISGDANNQHFKTAFGNKTVVVSLPSITILFFLLKSIFAFEQKLRTSLIFAIIGTTELISCVQHLFETFWLFK